MRIIFHIDMDAFFASIEIARNPKLKGKPVIVGGLPNVRGVVSTCSYEARAFGVRSAMSLTEAYRRCPQGIFLEGNYSLYRQISHRIMDIFHAYSSIVEVVSIDEAYLDFSKEVDNYDEAEKIAWIIKQTIWKELHLTSSIGIAANKLLAKIASSLSKPNGLLSIPENQEMHFLAPLSIEMLPGIGSKTQGMLNREGILLIKDLQVLSRDSLVQRYGAHGYYFFLASRGLDERPVESERGIPKSIGAESTFARDETNAEELLKTLKELVEKSCQRLKKNKMHAGGVSLKIRFSDFTTITRSHVLLSDTDREEMILNELLYLFQKHYQSNTPLRLLGITLEKLKSGYWQPSLWEFHQ